MSPPLLQVMRVQTMLLLAALLLLTSSCNAHRALLQYRGELSHSGKVMGYVVCDACLERNLTKNSILIPGATVALTCKVGSQDPFYSVLRTTDSHGRFIVDLPSDVSNSEAGTRLCSAKVVKGPLGTCSTPLNSEVPITFHAMLQGRPVFSTGPFVYTPSKPLASCPPVVDRKSTSFMHEDERVKEEESVQQRNDVYGTEKAPAFPNLPKLPPLSFPGVGGLPSTPASQFPVTSLFPPIPANPPPLFPQIPPISGFPQLPAFQFPFFPPPPPGT